MNTTLSWDITRKSVGDTYWNYFKLLLVLLVLLVLVLVFLMSTIWHVFRLQLDTECITSGVHLSDRWNEIYANYRPLFSTFYGITFKTNINLCDQVHCYDFTVLQKRNKAKAL